MLQRIHWNAATMLPLWSTCATRSMERSALATPPTPSLMQRAGLSIARLAQAVAPHARQAWVLCGPGNNGGDGLVAAHHLSQQGLTVHVHWLGEPGRCSPDSLQALRQAQSTKLQWHAPDHIPHLSPSDVVIDALLGLGQQHTASPPHSHTIQHLLQHSYTCPAHTVAVDIPTGLDADHGQWLPGYAPPASWHPASRHTLSLLTLKTGLFTASGRDASGTIWWDDLETAPPGTPPTAWLNPPPKPMLRQHNSHKGSFSDVLVIGGSTGMTGAALLAASAALHHGAGRTLLHLLAPQGSPHSSQPDWMQADTSSTRRLLPHATTVCGCGGGTDVETWIPDAIALCPRLVLDADALNALSRHPDWQTALRARQARQQSTILTPHPLEAARLLGCDTASIQAQRLPAAQSLAERLQCTVVLKGSGSIIASPCQTPHINPTGNARLATGGTGDVLAGLLAARWQAHQTPHSAACQAVWEHGALADQWPRGHALTASTLAQAQLQ